MIIIRASIIISLSLVAARIITGLVGPVVTIPVISFSATMEVVVVAVLVVSVVSHAFNGFWLKNAFNMLTAMVRRGLWEIE